MQCPQSKKTAETCRPLEHGLCDPIEWHCLPFGQFRQIGLQFGKNSLAPKVARIFKTAAAVISFSRAGEPGVLLCANPAATIAVNSGRPTGGASPTPGFFTFAYVYEEAGDVAGGVGVIKGVVTDVAVGVVVMAVERVAEDGVRGEETFVAGVVEAAFHVNKTEVIVVFVAGEAVMSVGGSASDGGAVGVDALPVWVEVERCCGGAASIEGGGDAAKVVGEVVLDLGGVGGAGDDLDAVAIGDVDVMEVFDGTASEAFFVEAADGVGDSAAVGGFDTLPERIVGERGGLSATGDSAGEVEGGVGHGAAVARHLAAFGGVLGGIVAAGLSSGTGDSHRGERVRLAAVRLAVGEGAVEAVVVVRRGEVAQGVIGVDGVGLVVVGGNENPNR